MWWNPNTLIKFTSPIYQTKNVSIFLIHKFKFLKYQHNFFIFKITAIDSKFENLASTYVNAFVHVGLGKDALMQPPKDDRNN